MLGIERRGMSDWPVTRPDPHLRPGQGYKKQASIYYTMASDKKHEYSTQYAKDTRAKLHDMIWTHTAQKLMQLHYAAYTVKLCI